LGVLFAAYAVELALWFLLIKTYSRGGLVAAVAAMVVFFILHGLRGTGCQPVGLEDKTRASHPCHPTHPTHPTHPARTSWKPVLRRLISEIMIRVVVVAVLCAAVGFVSRISPSYVAQDKSVLNRVELWKGALAMMSDSPFYGWGTGQGGRAFANWYQPLDKTVRPMSFVNSYLDTGVEQGAHILCLVLIIGIFS